MEIGYYISKLNIKGYKPFKDTTFEFSPLEVIVGANGSGKSSLFEFLRFLRDAVDREIPPEIVKGAVGQQLFNLAGAEKFSWKMLIKGLGARISHDEILSSLLMPLRYSGELMGPKGKPSIVQEKINGDFGFEEIFENEPSNTLGLSKIRSFEKPEVSNYKRFLSYCRFYSSFKINTESIRKSVLIEQEPLLFEDAGNLSSVLHFLMTEHPHSFNDLQFYLKSTVPGFKGLTVKARGGPGEVIAFWKEDGIDGELTIADLSDGIIRLICWIVLCVHPNPPSLICIDEPDQGVHPRTLPVLAALFKRASERTQILLATHSSYFLTQFDLGDIAVMKKENGEVSYSKPGNSDTLKEMLKDFGPEEIEAMHQSDELERLS